MQLLSWLALGFCFAMFALSDPLRMMVLLFLAVSWQQLLGFDFVWLLLGLVAVSCGCYYGLLRPACYCSLAAVCCGLLPAGSACGYAESLLLQLLYLVAVCAACAAWLLVLLRFMSAAGPSAAPAAAACLLLFLGGLPNEFVSC